MKPIQPDLKFDENGHVYTWKGRIVPSVTQVLSSVGVRVKMPELQGEDVEYKGEWIPVGFDDRWIKDDTAAQFGSAFHKVAAGILEEKEVYYPDAMEPWIAQFRRFVDDAKIVPKRDANGTPMVEYPLCTEKHPSLFCGTFDCAVDVEKPRHTVLIYDWKTGTGKESFWGMQLAAYGRLLSEQLGCYIIGKVVRFSESGYKVFDVYGESANNMPWWNFTKCLDIYKMVRGE
jgi:hypothetical protein